MELPETWRARTIEVGDEETWSYTPRTKERKSTEIQQLSGMTIRKPYLEEIPHQEQWRKYRRKPDPTLPERGYVQPIKRAKASHVMNPYQSNANAISKPAGYWNRLPAVQARRPTPAPQKHALVHSKQAFEITSGDVRKLLEWWNLMEKFPDRAKQYKIIKEETIVDPFIMLKDTFAANGNVH